MFYLEERQSSECPPGEELCHPLSKVIFFGTLLITVAFFGAIVWSKRFRQIAISPERRRFYDEDAFFAVAVIALVTIIAFAWFV
jgi:uncharacterized iron-regulated membrane protein